MLQFFICAKGHFLYSLHAHINHSQWLDEVRCKGRHIINGCRLADTLPIQRSNIFSSTSLYKLGEASSPCVLRPCPCGVICSYWEHLAGFPKRSYNLFRQLLHSDMYQFIRHYFWKHRFQKIRLIPWHISTFHNCRKLHFLR
jgi:hypothetical protein